MLSENSTPNFNICNKMSKFTTYQEKTVHATLKKYFEPNTDFHEIPYKGYVADVKNADGIVEIQSGSFARMKPKLTEFLVEDEVTLVYPLIRDKWVVWLDVESGEIVSRRKSPRKGRLSDALCELNGVREFIENERLHIKIIEVDVDEYKKLDGYGANKKSRATKVDRVPIGMGEFVEIETIDDLRKLLPIGLSDEFKMSDFEKSARLKGRKLWSALKLLVDVGIVEREDIGVGKQKKYLYKIK